MIYQYEIQWPLPNDQTWHRHPVRYANMVRCADKAQDFVALCGLNGMVGVNYRIAEIDGLILDRKPQV